MPQELITFFLNTCALSAFLGFALIALATIVLKKWQTENQHTILILFSLAYLATAALFKAAALVLGSVPLVSASL